MRVIKGRNSNVPIELNKLIVASEIGVKPVKGVCEMPMEESH